ncbi:MAG: hypothetical protein R3F62_01490 [Planctomycetota bacterium]
MLRHALALTLVACVRVLANPVALGPGGADEPAPSSAPGLGVVEWTVIALVCGGGVAALFALRGRRAPESAS